MSVGGRAIIADRQRGQGKGFALELEELRRTRDIHRGSPADRGLSYLSDEEKNTRGITLYLHNSPRY